MASAIKYLTNVTKSIKYASIDAIKEMNPVITEAIETNEDVLKTTYSTIKNFKAVTNRAYMSMKSSQIGELAIEAKKNLFQDIKNGTFYNRERIAKVDAQLENDFKNDSDFSFDDDDDFGGGDDFGSDDDFGMDDLADTIDSVGEKSSSAVSQVIARSAEYQVEATKQSTMQILARQSAMTSMMHSDLAAINTNMANMQKFNTEVMTTHINNSANFYARQQEQMSEQTELLRKLVDITEKHFQPDTKKSSNSNKLTADDIMDSSGNVDIVNYAKYIKQNIKNNSSGMGDMLDIMKNMGMGKELVASPLQGLTVAAVKAIVPGVLKDSMEELNDTVGNVFSTFLTNITSHKNEDGILGKLADVMGLNGKYKKTLDTSKYNKKAANWTGKDNKALTIVIPTLLSKIYSAISGDDELRYDYESGKFVKFKSIKSKWDNKITQDMKMSGGDFYTQLSKAINDQVDFGGNEKSKKSLQDTLDRLMKSNMMNMKTFNPESDSLDARTYGLKGADDQYNLQILAFLTKMLPQYQQLVMSQSKNIINTVTRRAREISSMEESGNSLFESIFDNSTDLNKIGKNKNKGSKATVKFGKDANKYLYNINKEVAFIREILTAKNTKSGFLKKSKSDLSFDSYKFYGDKKEKPVEKKENAKEDKKKDSSKEAKEMKKFYLFKYGQNAPNVGGGLDLSDIDIDDREFKEGFLDKMAEAETMKEKLSVIVHGVDDLVKAPANFLAGAMQKADSRIYSMLYGTGKYKDEGLMGKITKTLNDWADQQIKITKNRWDRFKDDMKKKFSKEGVSSFFTKFVAAFGFDKNEMGKSAKEYFFGDSEKSFFGNIKTMFKKGFQEIWGGIKKAFKSVFGPIKRLFTGEKNKSGKLKEETNDKIMGFKGAIEKAAKGIRRVKKTGIIAVSKGEMIVPPDQNPHNIKRRSYNENIAIKKYKKYFGDNSYIPSYAEGGEYTGSETDEGGSEYTIDFVREILRNINHDDWLFEHIPFNDKEKFNELIKFMKSTDTGNFAISILKDKAKNMHIKKYTKDDYVKGKEPLAMKMKDEAKNIKSSWSDAFAQTDLGATIKDTINKSKNKEAFKEAQKDIGKNIKDYLPTMAAGGATGAALSAIFGLVGGPLLGAAAGTSIALIKNSDKVQNWLFGEEVTDEEGNKSRKGGVLSKDLSNNIQKYFPDMAKGSIVGGITSILPFVPGGPITGVLLGSAIGFAKNNEKIKNALFGEDKILGKAKDKVQKMLPKMGLGAMAGAIAGPFGLVTNIAVGAALGMASDTNKFKDIVFGREGANGKRYGGIVGAIKDHLDRGKEYLKDIGSDLKQWFDKSIKSPIQDFVAPLKQQGKLILRWFKSSIHDAFESGIKKPIAGWLYRHVLRPAESKVGKIVKGALTIPKTVLSTPFKVAGAVGRSVRRRQLTHGTAYDLTAEERLEERQRLFSQGVGLHRVFYNKDGESRGGKFLNKISGGRFKSKGKAAYTKWSGTDQQIKNMANMTDENGNNVGREKLQELQAKVQLGVQGKKKFIKEQQKLHGSDAINQLEAYVAKGDIDEHIRNSVKTCVLHGRHKQISSILSPTLIPEPDKSILIKRLVKAAKDISKALKIADASEDAQKEMYKALQDAGFADINDAKAASKFNMLLTSEIKAGKSEDFEQYAEEEEKEKQKKSPVYQKIDQIHEDLIDRLDTIIKIFDQTKEDIEKEGETKTSSPAIKSAEFKKKSSLKEAIENAGLDDIDEESSDDKDSLSTKAYNKLSKSKVGKSILHTKMGKKIQSGYVDDQMEKLKQNGLFGGQPLKVNNFNSNKKPEPSENTNLLKRMATYLAVSVGDTKGATDLLSTNNSLMGASRSSLKSAISKKVSEVKNKAHQFITDASGRILKTKTDAKGDTVVDTSDSETNNALKEQKAEQGTQKGILGKITGLADGFKGLFGKKDEDGDEKKGGFFSKIFSGLGSILGFGKSLLSGKALAIGGGLAGLVGLAGLSQKTIKTKKKDANGNVMTDENGNPIMEEKTLGEIISNGIKKAVMGEDGTGETSGIFFHVKNFITTKAGPFFEKGMNTFLDVWLPKIVEYIVEKLPTFIGNTAKGTAKGLWAVAKNAFGFGDSDSAPDSSSTSSAIEGNYSMKTNSGAASGNILLDNNSTQGNTDTNSASTQSTTSSEPTAASVTVPTIPKTSDMKNENKSTTNTSQSSQQASKPTSATTKISDSKKKKMRSSAAFKDTNENVRRKATGQLADLWDQPTKLGKTVGEILNDKDTVLAEVVDQDTGKTIQITGANILNYPVAAQQILGINVSLTDEERSKYTKELGLRQKKDNLFTKIGRGIFHRTLKGPRSSKATTKFLKAMDKVTAIPGKVIKAGHPGAIRRTIGTGVDLAINAPFKAVKGYDAALDNISILGFKDGMHYNALAAKDIAKDSAKKALKKTKTAKRIDRFKKVKNFIKDKNTKAKNFIKKHSITAQKYSRAKTSAKNKVKDIIDNKKKQVADKAKDIKDSAVNKMKNKAKSVKNKVTEKATNVKTKITEKAANAKNKVVNKVKNSKVAQTTKKVTEKVANSKAGSKIAQVAQKMSKKSNKGLIGKAIKWASEGIKGFFKKISGKVASGVSKIVGGSNKIKNEVIVKALEKAAAKITKKFEKNLLGKAGAKVLGKLAAYIGSSTIAAIADAMISFTSGMYNADVILKVKSPNFLMRVLCGAANAVNNVFCLGIIDTGDIFEFIYTVLKKAVPALENSSFEKSRQETAKEVLEYNKKNGTNISVEEYLKKDKFTTKISNGAKKIWGGIKTGAGFIAGGIKKGAGFIAKGATSLWNGAKSVVGGAVDKVKDIGSKAWNGAKNAVSAVKDKAGDIVDGAKNVVGGAVNKAKDIGGKAVSAVKNAGSSIANFFGFGGGDDKEEEKKKAEEKKKKEKSIPAKAIEAAAIATNPVLGAMTIAKNTKKMAGGAVNAIKNLFGFGKKDDDKKDGSKEGGAVSKIKNIASSAFDGVKNFFGFGKKNDKKDEKHIGTVKSKKKDKNKDLKETNNNLVKKATKESQRLVAINLGLADYKDKDVDLAKILKDKKYLDKRAKIVQQNSSIASLLSGISGSNTADEKAQTKQIAKANSKSNNKNKSLGSTIVSGVKHFFGKVGNFLFGKGSGVSMPAVSETDNSSTGFISQRSSKWANKTFRAANDRKRYTVKDAGCAPAAASMAINANWQSMSPLSMNQAIKDATAFKIPNGGGVTADYFAKEFANHGFETAYVTGKGSKKRSTILRQLKKGTSLVLMGVDPKNKSKKSSPFGPNAHYVVATGLSPDGKHIYINDPEAKKPNIAYPTDTIIKSTTLGIIPIKSKKKISNMLSASVKKALRKFSGKATGKVIYIGMARVMGIKRALSDTSDFEFLRWADYKDKKKGKTTYKEDLIKKVKSILSKDDDWGSAYIIFYLVNGEDKAKDTITKMEKECGNASVWQVSEAKKNGNKFTSDENRYINIRDFVLSKMDKNGKLSDEAHGEIHDHISEAIGSAAQASANSKSNNGDNSEKKYSSVTDLYTLFDDLAKYYGLADGDSDASSGTDDSSNDSNSDSTHLDTGDIKGNVSKNKDVAEKQKKLAAQMKSVEGKLKYCQNNKYYPGPRDPDQGGGDCSSTVQWAYKKVLGDKVDVGSTTDAMRSNSNTYQVASELDESKMQIGDLVLMPGHVEMYYGDGKTIGHGGGPDGKTKGTKIYNVSAWPHVNMIRRLKEFDGKGSGVDGFISQTDPSYRSKTIKDETVEEAGCAPAVASMMVSRFKTGNGLSMNQAIKSAAPYKSTGGGISADYFIDQLEKQGLSALMITGKNKAEKIIKILKSGKPVALLGKNSKNKSKNKCPFGPQAHYVLAIGISNDNKTIYINDPEMKRGNAKYPINQIIPYVQIAIAGVPKNQNKELDKLSKKIRSELKKFRGRGKYGKDSNEYKVWNGLRNAGYSEIATAGAMGNIYGESGFNPKSIEAGSGAGFGLIQWTGVRRTKIEKYAKDHKKDVNSVDLQVEYLLLELDPNSGTCAWAGNFGSLYGVGPYTRNDWVNAKKVDEATRVYCVGFERPAVSAYNSSIQKRIDAAEGYYKEFMGSDIDPNAISSSGGDSDGSGDGESKNSVYSTITDVYNAFSDLATAYGLGTDSGDSSSDSDDTSSDNGSSDDTTGTSGSDYPKYKLSKDQVKFVAGVVTRETGGEDKIAAMQEASQMANLNEVFKKKKATADNLISTLKSGWYAKVDDPITPTKTAKSAVRAVMNKGHRLLPRYVTEHDMFPLDAAKADTWNNNKQDRTKYKKDKTKIKQNPSRFDSPAEYTFYDFFGKNKDGDVSGYYSKDYDQYKDDVPWTVGGKGSGLTTPNYSGSSRSSSISGSNTTKIVVQNQNNNDNTSQLIDIVVKLLSQVVDNTSSIKDIASLLVKVLGSSNTKTNNSNNTSNQALLLQALQQSSQTNLDSSLESLIANVEAIAAQ